MGAHNHQRTNVATGAGLRTPVSCAGLVRGTEVGILLRQLAHSIYVSDAMSTAAARCQQGALVVREKDFVARGAEVVQVRRISSV